MRTIFILEVLTSILVALAVGRYFGAPYREQIPVLAVDDRDAEEQRIRRKLRLPAKGWEFMEAPLSEVANWLSEELDVPVRVDNRALAQAGKEQDPLITRDLSSYRRDGALTKLTHDEGLIWHITEGEILITTENQLQLPERLDCCVYPVRKLVMLRDDEGEFDDGEALIDQIAHCVDTSSWDFNGGQASMSYLSTTKTLTITAPAQTQRKIANLLEALEKTRAAQGVVQPPSRSRIISPGNSSRRSSGPGCLSIIPIVGSCGF